METQLDHLRTLGKEIDMRTGNVFLLLLLVLIGFGALLYYSIDLTLELAATRDQLAQVQSAMQTLEVQHQTLAYENERLSAENANLAGANASLLAQLTAVENDRLALEEQVNTLQAQLAVMEKAHPFLAWLASSSAYRFAALFVLPAVPITFGVVYVVNHKRIGAQGSSVSVIHTALTAEEFNLIVQRRKLLGLRRRLTETVNQTDDAIKR
jgi:hypothetical protein